MERVKLVVNIFTIYQLETNVTKIECDLSLINSVLSKIGLIARQDQFEFYLRRCWHKREENSLQIEHILPLAVEVEEVEGLKKKLSKWISSDEYAKRFLRTKNRSQANSREAKKLEKIKISYLPPPELLTQIEVHQLKIETPP